MPQSIAAEAALLGSIIFDSRCLAEVAELVTTESFYRYEHRTIYDAIFRVSERGPSDNIDCVLLRDELVVMNKLEDIGGVYYLVEILETVPSSANALYYAKIVRDKYLLRQLIEVGRTICEGAYDQSETTDELIDKAEACIFAIGRDRQARPISELRELLPAAYSSIEARRPGELTGLSTGFVQLDKITCGLQKGDVIVIATRPSIGKTSFALNTIEDLLINNDVRVALFSMEMGSLPLAEQIICSLTQLQMQKVRRGELDVTDFAALAASCERLANTRLWIDDASVLTPSALRSKARRLKAAHDIGCIVIDYLQLIRTQGRRFENRQQEITKISRSIKSLAMDLNVPILLLSQLNRAPANRSNFMPRLTDLRESGSIEQDADVVLLLHREDYYHRGEADYCDTNEADLIVAKQRNGPTGAIKLIFRPEVSRFENYTPVENSKEYFHSDDVKQDDMFCKTKT
jgi:replicative DNA helicase